MRPAVRERLGAATDQLDLPRLFSCNELNDVLETGFDADADMLVLDLGSCHAHPNLSHVARLWEFYRPGSDIVLYTPPVDREAEMRTRSTGRRTC